jgi:hypothetical protein
MPELNSMNFSVLGTLIGFNCLLEKQNLYIVMIIFYFQLDTLVVYAVELENQTSQRQNIF